MVDYRCIKTVGYVVLFFVSFTFSTRLFSNALEDAKSFKAPIGFISGTIETNCRVLKKTKRKRSVFCRAPFRYMGVGFLKTDGSVKDDLTIVKGGWSDTEIDFQNNSIRKVHFCIALPTGSYHINNVRFSTPDLRVGGRDFGLEQDYLAPFQVEEKTITYLGTIHLKGSRGTYGNEGGWTKLYVPESISVRDEFDENNQTIISKCQKHARRYPIQKNILHFGNKGSTIDFYDERFYFYSTPPYYKPNSKLENKAR